MRKSFFGVIVLLFGSAFFIHAQQPAKPTQPAPKEVAIPDTASVKILKLQRDYLEQIARLKEAQQGVQQVSSQITAEVNKAKADLKLPESTSFDQDKLVFVVPQAPATKK